MPPVPGPKQIGQLAGRPAEDRHTAATPAPPRLVDLPKEVDGAKAADGSSDVGAMNSTFAPMAASLLVSPSDQTPVEPSDVQAGKRSMSPIAIDRLQTVDDASDTPMSRRRWGGP